MKIVLFDFTRQFGGAPQLCAEFGKAGRKRVEKIFAIKQMIDKYQDIFLNVVGKSVCNSDKSQ